MESSKSYVEWTTTPSIALPTSDLPRSGQLLAVLCLIVSRISPPSRDARASPSATSASSLCDPVRDNNGAGTRKEVWSRVEVPKLHLQRTTVLPCHPPRLGSSCRNVRRHPPSLQGRHPDVNILPRRLQQYHRRPPQGISRQYLQEVRQWR